jgi:hypothetical protein
MDAVRIVEDEVRELIRRRGLDSLRQAGEVRRLKPRTSWPNLSPTLDKWVNAGKLQAEKNPVTGKDMILKTDVEKLAATLGEWA